MSVIEAEPPKKPRSVRVAWNAAFFAAALFVASALMPEYMGLLGRFEVIALLAVLSLGMLAAEGTLLVAVLVALVRHRAWGVLKAVGFNIAAGVAVSLVPWYQLHIEHKFGGNVARYEQAVAAIRTGKFEVRDSFVALPAAYRDLSCEGRARAEGREAAFEVLFYDNRWGLDRYTGFLYEADDDVAECKLTSRPLHDVVKLRKGWYMVAGD